jgi:hypothetical protein
LGFNLEDFTASQQEEFPGMILERKVFLESLWWALWKLDFVDFLSESGKKYEEHFQDRWVEARGSLSLWPAFTFGLQIEKGYQAFRVR